MTITGTNFAAGATVTFGGAAATSVVVVSGTQITATTPAGSAGTVTVTVTNPGAAGGSLASGFTYVAAADGKQCFTKQWVNGGWDGGDDHRDELCCGSDGNVRRGSSDERGGGERDADHGYDAGRQRGSGDGDSDSQWAERKPSQRIHLRCSGYSEQCFT